MLCAHKPLAHIRVPYMCPYMCALHVPLHVCLICAHQPFALLIRDRIYVFVCVLFKRTLICVLICVPICVLICAHLPFALKAQAAGPSVAPAPMFVP